MQRIIYKEQGAWITHSRPPSATCLSMLRADQRNDIAKYEGVIVITLNPAVDTSYINWYEAMVYRKFGACAGWSSLWSLQWLRLYPYLGLCQTTKIRCSLWSKRHSAFFFFCLLHQNARLPLIVSLWSWYQWARVSPFFEDLTPAAKAFGHFFFVFFKFLVGSTSVYYF